MNMNMVAVPISNLEPGDKFRFKSGLTTNTLVNKGVTTVRYLNMYKTQMNCALSRMVFYIGTGEVLNLPFTVEGPEEKPKEEFDQSQHSDSTEIKRRHPTKVIEVLEETEELSNLSKIINQEEVKTIEVKNAMPLSKIDKIQNRLDILEQKMIALEDDLDEWLED